MPEETLHCQVYFKCVRFKRYKKQPPSEMERRFRLLRIRKEEIEEIEKIDFYSIFKEQGKVRMVLPLLFANSIFAFLFDDYTYECVTDVDLAR